MKKSRFSKRLKQVLAFLLFALLFVVMVSWQTNSARANNPQVISVLNVESSPVQVKILNDDTYRISLDNGKTYGRSLPKQTEVKLRYDTFDPLVDGPPAIANQSLAAGFTIGEATYIVQFETQALDAYQKALKELGAEIYIPLADQSLIVGMDSQTRQTVSQLPYVRWVGNYEPAYKLEEPLVHGLAANSIKAEEPIRYSIMVLQRGDRMQDAVAARIEAMGGTVEMTTSQGYRMEAWLTPDQLSSVARMNEILFIDRWTPKEVDMSVVRDFSGGNYVESVQGYTGQGVRAEVMDSELRTSHENFSAFTPLIHQGNGNSTPHGTSVFSVVFGDGSPQSGARGMMPNAEARIFAYYGVLGGSHTRYDHTEELVDPNGPYRAVFQTNSWGDSLTTNYTTISAEMDDILFQNDIVILQSQSNAGSRSSRPQAWAKNIVSVGAFYHRNTLTKADDEWNGGASIGPAADGRIKPDLAHFYDQTYAASNSSNSSYTQFGGTSGATPITAGHFGLMFQMWADGVFNGGPGQNRDVFDSRPHMTTAKALMINMATQYPFSGTSADMTRVHQGWGHADLQNMYDVASANGFTLPLLVDESAILTPLQTHTYQVEVSGSSWLKATMVYADPMGPASSSQHRINDLSLRVTSPGGTVYWGNNGLNSSNWSTSGGSSNTVDTVENVFIENAQVGTWTIEVLGDEIVQDAHVETGATDADYALVVTLDDGVVVTPTPTTSPTPVTPTATNTPLPGNQVFFDDFESNQGWTTNPNGSDTATTGQWERANPEETSSGSTTLQLGTTVSGSFDLVTEGTAGSSAGTNDIDNGVTTIRSPNITLPNSGNIALSFWHYLGLLSNANTDDYLRVSVVGNTTSVVYEEFGNGSARTAVWAESSVSLNSFAGQTIYILVEAADGGSGSLVEAGIDDVSITADVAPPTATSTSVPPTATNTPIPPTATSTSIPPTATNTAVPPTATSTPAPSGDVFFDDFESDQGWTVNPNGSDNATTGLWERTNPEGTTYSGSDYQLGATASGSFDLVTGGSAGSGVGSNDIDGGTTSVRSPNISLPSGGNLTLSFDYYLSHYSNSGSDDFLRVSIVGNTTSVVFEELGAGDIDAASWASATANLNSFAGQTVYILIEAADGGGGSLVEAAVDDVRITSD